MALDVKNLVFESIILKGTLTGYRKILDQFLMVSNFVEIEKVENGVVENSDVKSLAVENWMSKVKLKMCA